MKPPERNCAKPASHLGRRIVHALAAVVGCCLLSIASPAATVSAIYNSAADVPVTASGYTATGNTVSFTLNFAPPIGTDLTVVNNTGLGFISGAFDNLAQGQAVLLSYGGTNYAFLANYYGGSGNDLILMWANERGFAWGNVATVGIPEVGVHPVPLAVDTVSNPSTLFSKTIVGTALGQLHALALCSDGTVAAWGDNYYGELGNNSRLGTSLPVPVNTASGVSALYGKTVIAIAAGSGHSLALCSDGTLAAWGNDHDGEFGDNGLSGVLSSVPVAVNTTSNLSALYGKTVVAFGGGGEHSLALCSDGTLVAWGDDRYGELGDNGVSGTKSLVPVAVDMGPGSALYGKTVVAIAVGGDHNLVLCSDSTLAAWGYNAFGEVGDNTTTNRLVPVAVNTSSNVSALYGKSIVAIAVGSGHSLALCSDGTLASWGWNTYGQLGDNTTINRLVPVMVNTNLGISAIHGKTVTAIVGGAWHSLALCSDGSIAAWGRNSSGQLGDTTVAQRTVPVAVNTTNMAPAQRFSHIATGSSSEGALAVVAAPPAGGILLGGGTKLTNGSFQFTFTNTPGAFFGVLGTTNPSVSLANWTPFTGLAEVSPGQFRFSDPQATNTQRRFYRVRSP